MIDNGHCCNALKVKHFHSVAMYTVSDNGIEPILTRKFWQEHQWSSAEDDERNQVLPAGYRFSGGGVP